MRSASLSIKVFGVYAMATGIGLFLAPALVLSPLGFAVPTEIWVRVLGAVTAALGFYYWACGSAGATAFFRASIPGRLGFATLCTLLVIFFSAPPQLLLFGAVDTAGALWTALALRREPQPA
jgi:hypothetical protein